MNQQTIPGVGEVVDAADAITAATVPDLPRETPRPGAQEPSAGDAAPAAPPAAAAAASSGAPTPGALDIAGTPWSAAIHEPARRTDGRWKLKRGTAGRLAKGQSLTGSWGKQSAAAPPRPQPRSAPAPASRPSEATPATSAPTPPPASRSLVVIPPDPNAAPPPQPGGEAPPAEVPPTPEDYAETGEAVTVAQFSAAQLVFGDGWQTDRREHEQWREAWAAALCRWRAPKAGPGLRLLVLLIVSLAKRRNDPETRMRLRDWWAKVRGWRGARPAAAAAPDDSDQTGQNQEAEDLVVTAAALQRPAVRQRGVFG